MASEGLLKDILLSEIIEGDVRAKRSLRVIQHQQGRINTLEDELVSYMNKIRIARTPSKTVIKEADSNSGRIVPSEIDEATTKLQLQNDLHPRTTKPQTMNQGYFAGNEEDDIELEFEWTGDSGRKSSKLELRAARLWETACKFFTPEQAHFILTAPKPHDEPNSEEDE